jgi:hypothetical protein
MVHPTTTMPLGDQALYLDILSQRQQTLVHVPLYRRCGGTHCPLIEEMPPDQGMGR